MRIRVAHSPDADDYFLFWPIRSGLVSTGDYRFEFQTLDTEDLNAAARAEAYDVVAVSVGALPTIPPEYSILTSGASVGRKYGPKLIVSGEVAEDADQRIRQLRAGVIGVPGETTTAARLVRQMFPDALLRTIPLSPFSGIFAAVNCREVDAAVVIHEGQLAYGEFGCSLLADLGVWWFEKTGLPLPVGVNLIHNGLGGHRYAIAKLLRFSVRSALDAQEEILPELLRIDAEQGGKLNSVDAIRSYLQMYANEDSFELSQDARRAIVRLSEEPGHNNREREFI